jgi:hypothetical protein
VLVAGGDSGPVPQSWLPQQPFLPARKPCLRAGSHGFLRINKQFCQQALLAFPLAP